MRRAGIYILIGLVLAAAVWILASKKEAPKFDERLSFRKQDKIPYGMYIAFQQLSHIFPKARIEAERKKPGLWEKMSAFNNDQALIVITPQFTPDEYEMKRMIDFIERGNEIFISTITISPDVMNMLQFEFGNSGFPFAGNEKDSLKVSLVNHPVGQDSVFSYPGKGFDSYFESIDTATTSVLGYNDENAPNLIRLSAGKGHLFLHLAPLAFSNYFLLNRDNIHYYENAMSLMSPDKTAVVWDEYFITRPDPVNPRSQPGWMDVLMSFPGFRWGLITALLILVVFALMEIRRKQRIIPMISKPRNDSLDFVKTIGRLYHDKGDHYNLCRKMSSYFLEHVRSRYKLNTSELDEEFIQQLQFKSGVGEAEIRPVILFIANLDKVDFITSRQLEQFHKQLEIFYQKA